MGASTSLSRATAIRVIDLLRGGSSCLDAVGVFSAGREGLYQAAEELFSDRELDNGSAVRWIKGAYGSGKTHSFARLIEIANRRKWVRSYVQVSGKNEGVELHHFEEVLAAMLRNMAIPQSGPPDGSATRDGWQQILDGWVLALRAQAGCRQGGDLKSMMFDQAVSDSIAMLRRGGDVHGAFAEALRQYALASRDGDLEWQQLLREWFGGADVFKRGAPVRKRLRESGILEPVSRKNAKSILRQVSAFIKFRGFEGTLILLDEVENVLLQPPAARRAAYTTLRELIDNVDDQHGMKRTLFYISGTPDLFDSPKGILEYEALAARALPPRPDSPPNPLASVIDLSQYPIDRKEFLEIGCRIADIYGIARNMNVGAAEYKRIADLQALIDPTGRKAITPRVWVKSVVTELDTAIGIDSTRGAS